MKKKIVVLLSLVLVMCCLFCACGSDETKKADTQNEEVKEVEQEEETLQYGDLAQYVEVVELSTENWKEYTEIGNPPADRTDLVGQRALNIKDLGAFSTDIYGSFVLEFSNNIYMQSDLGDRDFLGLIPEWCDDTIDELVANTVKCKIILLKDIPQEMIQTDENGTEYIEVEETKIIKGEMADLSAIVESQK